MKLLLLASILLMGYTVAPFVIEDGIKYDAKAFNWDKEKWIDVQVVFNKDEATLFLSDETRTLFLVHPRKPKNPSKIEAIDGERDVHWDIKIEAE